MKLAAHFCAAEQHHACSQRVRCGHTLFEVLVALGLSLTLLAAVYSALDLHWKYSAAGQEETERLQLVRALFMKMEGDVRGIVYRRPFSIVQSQNSFTVTRSLDANIAQTSDPYGGYCIGLVGDTDRLLLKVSEVANDSPPVPEPSAEQLHRTGNDVHSVLWFMSRDDDAEKSKAATGQTAGLTRLATSQFVFDPLDGQDNLKDGVTPDDVLAAEIKTIRFRYFDGSQWLDQWDSVAMRRLPRAVEIIIGFDTASFALRDFDEKQHSGSYRLVVAVPVYET